MLNIIYRLLDLLYFLLIILGLPLELVMEVLHVFSPEGATKGVAAVLALPGDSDSSFE